MLKKMTKESEAELSEKKTIHSNNFIIYLWSKMKMVVELEQLRAENKSLKEEN